jgi:hypothetical protein
MHRSKRHRYSITSSARASSVGGTALGQHASTSWVRARLSTLNNFVFGFKGKYRQIDVSGTDIEFAEAPSNISN